MKKIYKAPLRKIQISNLEIHEGTIELLKYNTPVVNNILLYRGLFDTFVSFDYETVMPDQLEALDYVKAVSLANNITEDPFPTCTFVNPLEITPSHQIKRKEFKKLKKQYKLQRKKEGN